MQSNQWSKSSYAGPIENGWEEGKGRFTFPNGVVYDGQFNKGEFHGEGTLIYPNGVSTKSLRGESNGRTVLTKIQNADLIFIQISGSLRCQMGQRKADLGRVLLL